ncbi:MAG: hypothetical protein KGQ28_08815, partial [Hyphomicrobiales bacterium]|nr:hypothetical protein [Hyphomicrobiales bacterium]
MDRGSQRLGSRLAELDKSPETSRLLDGPPFGVDVEDRADATAPGPRATRRVAAPPPPARPGTPWAAIVAIGLVPVMAIGGYVYMR